MASRLKRDAVRFQRVSDEEPEAPTKAPPSLNYVPRPEHPPSPDYVPGPKETEQAPTSPDYNSHVRTVGHDVAYAMTWNTLKNMMTNKYCPRYEIKKLEIELWNLKVNGTDVESYSQRFQELALMCSRMFPEESEEVEKYVGGLLDMIQGSVMASKPKKISLSKGTMCHGPILQGLGKRNRTEDLNLCALNETTIMMDSVPPSHFTSYCLKLKNKNQGNQAGNGNDMARSYGTGTAGTNPNFNVVTGTFLLNNCYASILFDTGADRSFMSTAFCSLIDIIPTTLDHGYDVELADDRILWVNTFIRGCTLNFLNHPFNVNLMPVEMGSFDVIIGMDWLLKYHAVIVCDEKIIRIPFGNEILIVCGDESNNENGFRLNIISCTKTQKYLLKGCHVFLAHVTAKKAEDKSEEKRLEDVPIVRDFLEAPYRLASSEMKESSDQLQEHSDKGFIRPNSLPWGDPVLFVKKKDGSLCALITEN
ncbi:putative reverse transcriptase domain-containing protein [Tanacetum coccineum]